MFNRALPVVALAVALLLSFSVAAFAQAPGFKYQNATTESQDPQNADNDALKIVTTAVFPAGSGSITRRLLGFSGLNIEDLRNVLSLKYFFVSPRTCAGGTRIQIEIDKNDGSTPNPRNAFGYLGDKAFGGDCAMDEWVYEDMTNSAPKWDISQLGGGQAVTWSAVETFVITMFPNHKIRGAAFVDDSGSFAPTAIGTVYIDQLQLYNRTWGNTSDGSAGPSGF